MNNHELRDILNKIESQQSTNLQKITTKAGISRSYVSDLINDETQRTVGVKLMRKLTAAFPEYFKSHKTNKKNTEVEDGGGLKAGETSSDATGLILKSYLSTLAARHRAAADEIDKILQAMSPESSAESGSGREDLKAVHQILSDIEGKKDIGNKRREKGKLKP